MKAFSLLIYAIVTALLVMCFCGCRSTKRITNSLLVKTDSSKAVSNTSRWDSLLSSHSIHTKDSAIRIPARSLYASFTPEQLAPVYTAEGKPTARVYVIDTNGIRATITLKPDGSIAVKVNADSITIVVQNLIRERDYYKQASNLQKDSSTSTKSVLVAQERIYERIRSGLLENILLIALVILALFFGLFNVLKK